MWSEDEAFSAYTTYGVDLLRTGGIVVRTTPSVIYRAATLFQRYEKSVSETFRSRYLTPADMMKRCESKTEGNSCTGDEVLESSSRRVEYFVPEHAESESMSTGLVPLADLRAPLDYCVHHVVDQEDVTFLAAACLLVAAKMEDPGVRIRPIVNVFSRLADRRSGVVINEFLKPPPERYDDFKACVVKAEELLLHQLGFQTFVECPFKYAVVYLNAIVDDGCEGDVTGQDPRNPASTPSHSEAYVGWLQRAVSWLNDVPRFATLVRYPAADLALCALKRTCPSDVAALLPADWTVAFGVTAERLKEIEQVYNESLMSAKMTAREQLEAVRSKMPKPLYVKRSVRERALETKRKEAADARASSRTASPGAELDTDRGTEVRRGEVPAAGSTQSDCASLPHSSLRTSVSRATTPQAPSKPLAESTKTDTLVPNVDEGDSSTAPVAANPQTQSVAELLALVQSHRTDSRAAPSEEKPTAGRGGKTEEADGGMDIREMQRRRRKDEKSRTVHRDKAETRRSRSRSSSPSRSQRSDKHRRDRERRHDDRHSDSHRGEKRSHKRSRSEEDRDGHRCSRHRYDSKHSRR